MKNIETKKVLNEKLIKQILTEWAELNYNCKVTSVDVNLGTGGGEYGQSEYPMLRDITITYND